MKKLLIILVIPLLAAECNFNDCSKIEYQRDSLQYAFDSLRGEFMHLNMLYDTIICLDSIKAVKLAYFDSLILELNDSLAKRPVRDTVIRIDTVHFEQFSVNLIRKHCFYCVIDSFYATGIDGKDHKFYISESGDTIQGGIYKQVFYIVSPIFKQIEK